MQCSVPSAAAVPGEVRTLQSPAPPLHSNWVVPRKKLFEKSYIRILPPFHTWKIIDIHYEKLFEKSYIRILLSFQLRRFLNSYSVTVPDKIPRPGHVVRDTRLLPAHTTRKCASSDQMLCISRKSPQYAMKMSFTNLNPVGGLRRCSIICLV